MCHATDVRDDCYSARLRVLGVDVGDARDYVLNVENDKGADRYAVGLRVSEPVSMSTVIGIVIACLVLLVLVTLIVLYAFKTEKWCFSQKGKDICKWNRPSSNQVSPDGQKRCTPDRYTVPSVP
ncbi:hypothetical protein Pcinc_024445 [Petrolisthes cinctipes]|uniref:Uncharacterized protein n=1 Tax=Petrolisthes cinctipes TaxID=88211 RepID=A0AAE1FB97_PETCI|nr:hypothetical protein Pcinc_024445 [Petrolisthes cinctipes]